MLQLYVENTNGHVFLFWNLTGETLFIELPNLNHFRGLQIFFSQDV